MAYYAFLDENNVVTEVITGIDETELIEGLEPEVWYGNFRGQRCVRTSFNHKIRVRFAAIGYTYDETRDAFIPPKPYASWLFDEETYNWVAPTPMPEDDYFYEWVEDDLNWQRVGPKPPMPV